MDQTCRQMTQCAGGVVGANAPIHRTQAGDLFPHYLIHVVTQAPHHRIHRARPQAALKYLHFTGHNLAGRTHLFTVRLGHCALHAKQVNVADAS